MRSIFLFLILFILGILTLLFYAVAHYYCDLFVNYLTSNSMLAIRVAMLIAPITALVIPAYPLARLFGSKAWIAGAAIGWPLLAIFLWHTSNYAGNGDTKFLIMSVAAFEGILYWSASILGAWLASRRWPRELASPIS
jgi:hypothetical protein